MTAQLHNQLIPNVALDLPLDAVEIGKISMAFGIKGQFKVFIYQDGEALLHTKQWYMQPVNQQKVYCLNITQAKRQAKYIIGATDIFNNPEIVEQFKHAKIFVDKDALPELEDDEHYWQNLIN